MTHVSNQITIYAPADAIWQVISDCGMAGEHLPGVVDYAVTGDGIGARRTLTSLDGSRIVERLAALDAADQQCPADRHALW